MIRQKTTTLFVLAGFCGVLCISLITNLFLSASYARKQYETSAFFVNWFVDEYPDDEQKIMEHMKGFETAGGYHKNPSQENHLFTFGYHHSDFQKPYQSIAIISAILGALTFTVVCSTITYLITAKNRERIRQITDYLAKAISGQTITILPDVEDDYSGLQDEIYKTITELKTARENAVKERHNFAESLANIAHQIKTPIASISINVQMLKDKLTLKEHHQLMQQIDRADQLINALLTTSKIDAGILELKKADVDVYTVLELVVEVLESQIRSKNITVVFPNHPEVFYTGDLEWSVEVFINLIKNSIEHTADGGTIYFEYEKNPLYVEITITDNGTGFDENELPFIFERFYQGGSRMKSGTGIGLSMAKSIIEMQNGFITAKNASSGGACFVIRFYCH